MRRPIGQCLLVGATILMSANSQGELLWLAKAIPDATTAGSRYTTKCHYTPAESETAVAGMAVGGDSVEFSIGRDRSLLERLLGRTQSLGEATALCPTLVSLSIDPLAKRVTYSNCILAHMQGVTSNSAAIAIKQSCIVNAESPIAPASLAFLNGASAVFAASPWRDGTTGLYITINNNSPYTVTQIDLYVENKTTKQRATYFVRDLIPATPGGGMIVAMPSNSGVAYSLPPGLETFYVPIRETAPNSAEWGATYGWGFLGAKGFTP